MAPEMAYGRHHGPLPASVRRAAVLVVLQPASAGWSIPATLRPATMKDHAGQVALPGGLIEAEETPQESALREFIEELGPSSTDIEILGLLSPVFVFISNFEVTPLLAISHQPLVFRPNPTEVAEVVHIGVDDILNPACRGSHVVRRGEFATRAPHFLVAGHQIWGATSLILAELVELARRVRFDTTT
ncbi:MAG: CoA pyrophosphatase [Planctomycetaceae bacterium]|nr:CoA pyrophosphatase [Planctomycetaceae bacterium]